MLSNSYTCCSNEYTCCSNSSTYLVTQTHAVSTYTHAAENDTHAVATHSHEEQLIRIRHQQVAQARLKFSTFPLNKVQLRDELRTYQSEKHYLILNFCMGKLSKSSMFELFFELLKNLNVAPMNRTSCIKHPLQIEKHKILLPNPL